MLSQNIFKLVFLSAILALSLGLGVARAWAVEGVVLKEEVGGAGGDYCHLKFPAIEPTSLASDHPVLQNPDTGDMIDYYGPCDHDPLGKEEITKQLQDKQLYFDKGYDNGD
jgi:hypothetical protein